MATTRRAVEKSWGMNRNTSEMDVSEEQDDDVVGIMACFGPGEELRM